jgi:hypothetical protein
MPQLLAHGRLCYNLEVGRRAGMGRRPRCRPQRRPQLSQAWLTICKIAVFNHRHESASRRDDIFEWPHRCRRLEVGAEGAQADVIRTADFECDRELPNGPSPRRPARWRIILGDPGFSWPPVKRFRALIFGQAAFCQPIVMDRGSTDGSVVFPNIFLENRLLAEHGGHRRTRSGSPRAAHVLSQWIECHHVRVLMICWRTGTMLAVAFFTAIPTLTSVFGNAV